MKEPQETQVLSLGLEDLLGLEDPLQYSCPENPMDRGTWGATVHRVTKSWTRLKQLSIHTHTLTSGLDHASTALGMGSIPGQGTKIPHAVQCGQKMNKKICQSHLNFFEKRSAV